MELTSIQLGIAKVLLGGIAVGAVLFGAYSLGSSHGEAKVEADWTAERLQFAQESLRLQAEITDKEKAHQEETDRLGGLLVIASNDYAESIASIHAEFAGRLSNSEDRAAYYRRQAEAGPTESGNLAGHAAQLDRSLEEGRQLVKEFGATLGQCDTRTIILGEQILADRAAMGN